MKCICYCGWLILWWTLITIITCDNTNENTVDYYENLIVNATKASENYSPLTSSNSYRPSNLSSVRGM